ncbi:FAD-dependent oxidoreductase [Nonomuraea sp. NPDC050540]|uniref:FAD-dependent oxidoreductase n=1 Tax=Nonomuraea sp. NPDC050540 TaxID=3364367 RepID=UPI0037A43DD6
MNQPLRVLIAGAGLGGLCLAQGLRRAGVDVLVFERDAGPYSRAQGHRVHLDERGEDALRACLPEHLFDLYEATRGQPSERLMLIDAAGEHLREIPVPPLPDDASIIKKGRAVSRSTLREIMLAGLDDVVHYGKALTHYDHDVRACFADGTHVSGDVLVGADGIGSAVRRLRLPQARIDDLDIRWIGGKTPVTAGIERSLPDGLHNAFAAVTGMDPAMMIGYMRFGNPPPAAAGRLAPGLRLTDTEDFVMWAITVQRDRLTAADAALPASGLHRRALGLTTTAHPALRRVVEQAWPEHTFHLSIGTSVAVPAWDSDHVTLLGDAIHAMPPSRGSGANTALTDAADLARHLIDARRGRGSLPEAIGAYEHAMLERGFAAVESSTRAIDAFARKIIR